MSVGKFAKNCNHKHWVPDRFGLSEYVFFIYPFLFFILFNFLLAEILSRASTKYVPFFTFHFIIKCISTFHKRCFIVPDVTLPGPGIRTGHPAGVWGVEFFIGPWLGLLGGETFESGLRLRALNSNFFFSIFFSQ